MGNRKSIQVTGATQYIIEYLYYNNNRLIEDSTRIPQMEPPLILVNYYSYDNNGNELGSTSQLQTGLLSSRQNTLDNAKVYDEYNQLIKFNGNTEYTYEPDGLRLSKKTNGTRTYYLYNGQNLLMEINDSGNIVNSYIRGINLIKNSKNNYYVYNGHGDVI